MYLYCVFYKKEIIGRFRRKEKAIEYLVDCWHNGMNHVFMKTMTKEEYEKYCKKMIDNII